MLKGLKKHEDKEQGKTKHEAPRSINNKTTQNKNNTGTTAQNQPAAQTTEGFKDKLHPGSRRNSQTQKYIKCSIRIMAP